MLRVDICIIIGIGALTCKFWWLFLFNLNLTWRILHLWKCSALCIFWFATTLHCLEVYWFKVKSEERNGGSKLFSCYLCCQLFAYL